MSKYIRFVKSKAGATIVELMVVASIMGITVIAATTLSEISANMIQAIYARDNLDQLTDLVRSRLQFADSCTETLQNIDIDPLSPAPGMTGVANDDDYVTIRLPEVNNPANIINVTATPGTPFDILSLGLRITSIRLTDPALIDGSSSNMPGRTDYLSNLFMTVERINNTSSGAEGQKFREKYIGSVVLTVNDATNLVERCRGTIGESLEDVCKQMPDAIGFCDWDPNRNPKCLCENNLSWGCSNSPGGIPVRLSVDGIIVCEDFGGECTPCGLGECTTSSGDPLPEGTPRYVKAAGPNYLECRPIDMPPAPPPPVPCNVAAGTTWTILPDICAADAAVAIADGSSANATDATGPLTGSATYSCSAGVASYVSGTCSGAPPPGCTMEVTFGASMGDPVFSQGAYDAYQDCNSYGGPGPGANCTGAETCIPKPAVSAACPPDPNPCYAADVYSCVCAPPPVGCCITTVYYNEDALPCSGNGGTTFGIVDAYDTPPGPACPSDACGPPGYNTVQGVQPGACATNSPGVWVYGGTLSLSCIPPTGNGSCALYLGTPCGPGGLNKCCDGGQIICTSDIRLKENIIRVGRENGFNIYEFNYKDGFGLDSAIRYIGVMAQEVMKTRPDAVIKRADGSLAVNYELIGVKFREAPP